MTPRKQVKTHRLKSLASGKYGRWETALQKRLLFDAEKEWADLLEIVYARACGNHIFGSGTEGTLWVLEQATHKEYLSWRGRKAGLVKSDKKARNCRRNGAKSRGPLRKAA